MGQVIAIPVRVIIVFVGTQNLVRDIRVQRPSQSDIDQLDSATNAQQWDFETAMEGIDKQQVGLLVVTTTGNGSKEWIWHATDSKTFLDQTNDLLAKLPEYPLKIDFADDPGWTLYEKYMSNIKDLE